MFAACCILAGCGSQPVAKPPAQSAAPASLAGNWEVLSVEAAGKAMPPADWQGLHFLIGKDRLKASRKKGTTTETQMKGSYTIDAKKKPAEIDVKHDGTDETLPGIYEIDGDSLKLCFTRPDKPRPTTISSQEAIMYVLRRETDEATATEK